MLMMLILQRSLFVPSGDEYKIIRTCLEANQAQTGSADNPAECCFSAKVFRESCLDLSEGDIVEVVAGAVHPK